MSNTIGRHRYKDEIHYKDLIADMEKSGIDMAVVHCHAEYLDNDSVKSAFTEFPDRIIGLFTVDPYSYDATKDLEKAFKEDGFSGLYLNPIRQGFGLNEKEIVYPLLDVCMKYSKPFVCYGAAEIFSSPILFDEIATDYPELKIVMERMGLQYDNAGAAYVAEKHKNIYLETSGTMDFNVYRALKTAGEDRTLLGTGTPDIGVFEFELKKLRHATRDDAELTAKVLGKNAAKVFDIDLKKGDNYDY